MVLTLQLRTPTSGTSESTASRYETDSDNDEEPEEEPVYTDPLTSPLEGRVHVSYSAAEDDDDGDSEEEKLNKYAHWKEHFITKAGTILIQRHLSSMETGIQRSRLVFLNISAPSLALLRVCAPIVSIALEHERRGPI